MQLLPSSAALRRAVAKFHGLLRTGGNRKKPHRKSLLDREEDVENLDRWTLPEELP
jgi:hypothetical protein